MTFSHHDEPRTRPQAPSAPSIWADVLLGRYRIVDFYDREDRRYVIAEPRDPAAIPVLSARERRVLSLRARGHALKVIAAELGVSLSTASRDLSRAMRALGIGSDTVLAAVLGHG